MSGAGFKYPLKSVELAWQGRQRVRLCLLINYTLYKKYGIFLSVTLYCFSASAVLPQPHSLYYQPQRLPPSLPFLFIRCNGALSKNDFFLLDSFVSGKIPPSTLFFFSLVLISGFGLSSGSSNPGRDGIVFCFLHSFRFPSCVFCSVEIQQQQSLYYENSVMILAWFLCTMRIYKEKKRWTVCLRAQRGNAQFCIIVILILDFNYWF